MTTITHSPVLKQNTARLRQGAFTLVETMVSASIGAVIMTAVLTAFVFLARAGLSLQSYSDLEGEARNAIEQFALDVRIASDITWSSNYSLTLKTAASSGGDMIRYTYTPSSGTFARTDVDHDTTTTLISGITSFEFTAYSISTATVALTDSGGNALADYASANNNTKQVQISLKAERNNTTLATATNKVISARFILRNKHVTA